MNDKSRRAMFAKNKGNIIYDSHDGKYKLNGIPIHKGMKSKKEKDECTLNWKINFLQNDNNRKTLIETYKDFKNIDVKIDFMPN